MQLAFLDFSCRCSAIFEKAWVCLMLQSHISCQILLLNVFHLIHSAMWHTNIPYAPILLISLQPLLGLDLLIPLVALLTPLAPSWRTSSSYRPMRRGLHFGNVLLTCHGRPIFTLNLLFILLGGVVYYIPESLPSLMRFLQTIFCLP